MAPTVSPSILSNRTACILRLGDAKRFWHGPANVSAPFTPTGPMLGIRRRKSNIACLRARLGKQAKL